MMARLKNNNLVISYMQLGELAVLFKIIFHNFTMCTMLRMTAQEIKKWKPKQNTLLHALV